MPEFDTQRSVNQILHCLAIIALMIAAAIWDGFVVSVFWRWFAVPMGLPAIGTAHAVGIVLTISLVRSKRPKDDGGTVEETIRQGWKSVRFALAIPAFLYPFGWLAHRFMQ